MGRAGRYTLSVMVWVAAYAGWTSLLGIVVAAISGERLDDGELVSNNVSLAVSTLFSVLVPLVPTLTALWFNDWARDGFPTREDRRRAAGPTVAAPPAPVVREPAVVTGAPPSPLDVPPAAQPLEPLPAGSYPVAPVVRD